MGDVMHAVISRPEMRDAVLNFGTVKIPLADYETTGLCCVCVGPRGCGKTNAGQVLVEQLSEQGWCSLIIDPEGEMELMYGKAVQSPGELRERLLSRDKPIVVVRAAGAEEFVPYGEVILEVADIVRKPLLVMVDEGQLFSGPQLRANSLGEAARILQDFAERGRKRAIDFFVTALRHTGSVSRSLFDSANLTLIGAQRDSRTWSSLAPQFKSVGLSFGDLSSLGAAEFFCTSTRGVEKVRMPMAAALAKVAPKAKPAKRVLPATFSQWDRAMRDMPPQRLAALTDPVVDLLGQIAGVPPVKMDAGRAALLDELASR